MTYFEEVSGKIWTKGIDMLSDFVEQYNYK